MTAPILVTGASGFLGRAILEILVSHGHPVVGISRHPRPGFIPCDLEKSDLDLLPQNISAVIHAAAFVPERESLADPLASDAVNARGTLALLERYPDVPWIYLSSSTIGEAENFYEASKFGGELYTRAYALHRGFPLALLRLSYLYGPGMRRSTVVMKFIDAARKGEPLTLSEGGGRMFDFLHARDAARAIRLALLNRHSGFHFLGSGNQTSVKELAETIRGLVNPGLEIRIQGAPPPPAPTHPMDQLGWKPEISLASGLAELISCAS